MSDKPDDTETTPETEPDTSAESAGAPAAWNPAAEPPPQPVAAPAVEPKARRGSSPLTWFALLLVLALAVALGFLMQEGQRRELVLDQRLVALESVGDSQQTAYANLDKKLQRQLKDTLADALARVETTAGSQASELERLEAALIAQREEIEQFGATDRKDWLLAEAEYLLRLANQRLIMAGDVTAASALLSSADGILLELDEVSLHDARAAVAADLAALRAVPRIDVEGLYLRLAALIEQVERLSIFRIPDATVAVEAVPAEDWQGRLQQGYDEALTKLSDYIIIRRRDVPYEALMDPQWEGLVRQNMRMLLEQAQVALLSGNQVLFRESLERAGHWVRQFFEADEAGAQALARDINALMDQTVSVSLPDISRSLRELDTAVQRRLQLEGEQ